MLKRIFAMVLALTLCFVFVGCGGEKPVDNGEDVEYTYTLLVNKPDDWETNFTSYFEQNADGDPVAFIEKLPPCHLHMSDFLGDTKHLPAGEGDTDWAGIKRALGGDKYKGFYTLEPAYRFYIDDIPAKLKSAYEFLERTFGV